MRLPGINSDFAWSVYISLTRAECEWRQKNGLPQTTRMLYIRETNDEDDRVLVRTVEVCPPRHPVYGRLIEFIFWLGFIPF